MNEKAKETVADAVAAPEAAGAAPAPGPADDTRQAELEILKDRHLRLQADFDNFRKRIQRERVELELRATGDLVEDLLPVLDNFEIGLRAPATQQAAPAVREGFQMVYDQLLTILRKFGVMPFDAGGPFDPHLHEAVTHVPSPEHPPDVIIAQTRRGYRLGDKLLRAAQVVVSSGPPETPPAPSAPKG